MTPRSPVADANRATAACDECGVEGAVTCVEVQAEKRPAIGRWFWPGSSEDRDRAATPSNRPPLLRAAQVCAACTQATLRAAHRRRVRDAVLGAIAGALLCLTGAPPYVMTGALVAGVCLFLALRSHAAVAAPATHAAAVQEALERQLLRSIPAALARRPDAAHQLR